MNRQALEHIIRAATAVANVEEVIIVGSQMAEREIVAERLRCTKFASAEKQAAVVTRFKRICARLDKCE